MTQLIKDAILFSTIKNNLLSMSYSKYKQKKIGELKQRVFALYKQGYTLREVSDMIGNERSYTWILSAVKELEKPKNIA